MATEAPASAFVMHGAREVTAGGAVHIERQIIAIEEAVDRNPSLAFDLAKTLIESACKTILSDRGHACEEGWNLPKLLKETTGRLRLVPEGLDGTAEVAGSLRKTLGGLQTVVQGVCELRNSHGFASHGKDTSAQQLEAVQALLVARAADTIVNFLFRAHRYYPSTVRDPRLAYTDHAAFNEYVDDVNGVVRIFDLEYRPSEILFGIDLDAYRDKLAGFAPADQETEPEATDVSTGVAE